MILPIAASTTTLRPLDFRGLSVSSEQLETEEEGVLAILPDDQVVMLVGWMRIRVGHGGVTVGGTSAGEEWEYQPVWRAPKGLYERMKSLTGEIAVVRAERAAARKSLKRWDATIYIIGHEALTCPEVAEEVVEGGWLRLLRDFRP